MKQILIYCEGQTEESFVNEVLRPYMLPMDIQVTPIVCTTKRTDNETFKGGVSTYTKVKSELAWLCQQNPDKLVTTMFDYYRMPSNTPLIWDDSEDLYVRMNKIERAVEEDIGWRNLVFHLMLHEFEALLYSDPAAFAAVADKHVVQRIAGIREEYPNPEYINNSVLTAPSKRLIRAFKPRSYAKVRYGTLVAQRTGLEVILRECRHFREWVELMLGSWTE